VNGRAAGTIVVFVFPAMLAVSALLLCASAARAEGVAAPAPSAATPAGTPPETPSFLELAERLRTVGSFSECAVEALRYAYDHPADRERGFDRAALCLGEAGRHDDARRLMLALPAEGTPLGPPARLRICLSEVFLPDLDAPVCPALEPVVPQGRLETLGRYTLAMRAIRARHWAAARPAVVAPVSVLEPTLSAWHQQDLELLRRYDTLPRKSPWVAAALSAVIPGLGRVYIGRWPDGLISFLLVGLTAGLSAQGFHEEGRDSVRGWVLAGFGALLYAGNVYGSAVGALVQRREAEDALMVEIDRAYQRRLDP
jgi:hypothetical protein